MGDMVPRSRIVCEARCILHFDGSDYQGVIENISLSGALIELDDRVPDSLCPGATCEMIFCSDPNLYPVKYTCKVIRVDSAIVGIEFLELNIM